MEIQHEADPRAAGNRARECVDEVSDLSQAVTQGFGLMADVYTSKLLSEVAKDQICAIIRQEHREYILRQLNVANT